MQLRSKAVMLLIIVCMLVPVVFAEDALDWYTKGQNAATVGDYTGAITYYDKALAVDATFSPAMAQKAVALNQLGQYAEALTVAEQSLAIKTDKDALNARAYALFKLGRNEESIAAYDKLFTIQTNRAEAYCNQGTAYFYLNKLDNAVTSLTTCTKLLPSTLDGWNQLGMVYMARQDYEAALDAFNQCTQITTGNAVVWNNKGKALAALGKYQDARSCYNKALDLDPVYAEAAQNKAAITGLGQSYTITGTVTPTEVPVRFGTTIPATMQTQSAETTTAEVTVLASQPATEITMVDTGAPVTKKPTYSPLSPVDGIVALLLTGILFIGAQRIRK